jgi:hypothetical protein
MPIGSTTLSGVTAVSAGQDFSCGLTPDGHVTCWGNDAVLGPRAPYAMGNPPAVVPGVSSIRSFSAGPVSACAVLSDATVDCWGSVGLGPVQPTPTPVPGLTNVVQVTSGAWFNCALKADHTVACWGSNVSGELGTSTNLGSNTGVPTPTTVPGLSGVTQVDTGSDFSCARLASGTVDCWGENWEGELGSGTPARRPARHRCRCRASAMRPPWPPGSTMPAPCGPAAR